MTFKLRDGLSIGDRQVIDSDAVVSAKELFYSGNLPTARPRVNYNFAKNNKVNNLQPFRFRRISTATYVGSDGYIKTSPPAYTTNYGEGYPLNERLRPHYEPYTGELLGVLIEESANNFIFQSENFTAANWVSTNLTITPNSVISPDGLTTGTKIDKSESSGYIYQAVTSTTSRQSPYVFSIFAKSDTASTIKLEAISTTSATGSSYKSYATFELSGVGSIVSSGDDISSDGNYQYLPVEAKITRHINGWYRCEILYWSYPGAEAITSALCTVTPAPGSSTGSNYIWGAMLCNEYYNHSYLPTTTAAASTNGDQLIWLQNMIYEYGESQFNKYNQEEGTIVIEVAPRNVSVVGGRNYLFAASNSYSTSYGYRFPYLASDEYTNGAAVMTNIGYSIQTAHPSNVDSVRLQNDKFTKMCFTYNNRTNTMIYARDGVVYENVYVNINTPVFPGVPIVDKLAFLDADGSEVGMTLRSFKYYDKSFSEEVVRELSR